MSGNKKRGRPPNINKEKPATKEQINIIETTIGEPIQDFLKTFTDEGKKRIFAENLAKQLKRTELLTMLSSSNGKYQPIYSEQIFQSLNINPVAASSLDIERWLLAPHYFDKELRHLGQYLSYAVGQYQRSIYHLNTIKSFKYKLLPCNSEIDDADEYMKSYQKCLDTLQKLNIRYQLSKADFQTMQDGLAAYWIEEKSDSITLIPLPSDYIYITAPWTYGYLFTIDLVFFDKFVTMPQQIPELTTAYNKFVEMRKKLAEKGNNDDLVPFQYYNVPPDKGWLFTFNPTMPDKIPPMTPAMASSLDILSYKELLKNKVALDLYKIIPMKIPTNKENNQMIITYTQAEDIIQVIQSLLPDNIRVFASPFDSENVVNTDQSGRFDEIINISNDTFYASAGLSKSLFGSKEIKMGAAIKISSDVDFNFASYHPYRQYENFVNFQLGLKNKKYKFMIQMFGNSLNDKEERELALKEMTLGNSGILDYFSAKGYEPFQVKSMLSLEDKLGLRDLMQPLESAFNSKATNEGGSPKQTSVQESGEATRSYESNESRKFSLDNCLYCNSPLINNNIKGFCNESCKESYCLEFLEENN